MVNVQLSSSPPSSSTALAATTSSGFSVVQVSVSTVSTALEKLTHIIQTNATLVTSPDGNNLNLATALGNITVTLSQQLGAAEKQNLTQQLMNFLQTQRPLTLTLQAGSPPTQGTLLIPQTTPLTVTQNIQSPAPSQLLSPQSLVVGDDLPAIVLYVEPTSVLVPVATQPSIGAGSLIFIAPTGDTNVADSLSISSGMPTTTQEPTTNPVPQTMPSESVRSQEAPTVSTSILRQDFLAGQITPDTVTNLPPVTSQAEPQISQQIASLLTPNNEVVLRVDAILPPTLNNVTPPVLAPNQIVATVGGTGTGGQLILKAGDATLFVRAQVSAPIGTLVVVSVDSLKPTPLLTLPLQDHTNFQALPQVVAALAEANPQILQQMISSYLPQPTEALPGALLFLFSAFKQGNVRGWLGNDATDALTNLGKFGIISSLSKELVSAGQPTQDAVVGEWHSYPIPLFAQQQFQALTLHVHNDRDARKEKSAGASGTGKIRFLIDMKLSKLGAMQVDGFVQQKKLDMILRSEIILPDGLHHELRSGYIKALGAVGYAGTLNFQVGRQYWMEMQKSAPPGILT